MTRTSTARRLALPAALAAALVVAGCAASPEPAQPSAGGRDLAQEEANRELVLDFYDRFFNEHETEEAAEVVADDYIQHNPSVPDGKEPFVSFFTESFAANPDARSEVVRSTTDGDLVSLHARSTESDDDRGTAVVDIFRVEDGMIVEHWDVIQPVPEESANDNTMF